MDKELIISNTILFVKETLKNAEGGHDWFHIQRVWTTAKKIAESEPTSDVFIVELSALLHDIADSKFHDGNETLGSEMAKDFLTRQAVAPDTIAKIGLIIENISFKGGHSSSNYSSLELNIVQDADRLDAIGAIGIARAFNYGGFKNRELFNPDIPPVVNISKEAYKKSNSPTINHFYEKLLKVYGLLKTKKGKELGKERHNFLIQFLENFYFEWYGEFNQQKPDFHLQKHSI